MLRRLYDWTLRLAGHRHAAWWLFAVAVAEASFFPIPIEALLLPMMFAAPRRSWRYAAIATVGTVIGGALGYLIGALLYEGVAAPILAFYGYMHSYEAFAALYHEWGAWIVVAGGFTPIPYKVVAIASGAVHLDIWVFLLASLGSRGLRFAIEAALLAWFGPPIRAFVEQRLALVAMVSFVALVGGFAVIKWLW